MKFFLHRHKYMSELKSMLSEKLDNLDMGSFWLWFYTIKRVKWNVGLCETVIFSKVIKAIAKEPEVRNELYTRWVNMSHGMELKPDINTGHRGNENGILYLAEYIMCLHKSADLNTQDKLVFETIVSNLRYEDNGVYNRGEGESKPWHKYYVPPKSRRTISQDNITAIACGTYLLGNKSESLQIAQHGIKNFFVYNNIKPLRRFPLNPGNIPTWLALGGYKKAALLFMPIYVINFIITMLKNPQDTSSKKLYLLELYTLRDVLGFKTLGKIMDWRLRKQYGDNYINAIYSIYYPAGHPLREITK